MQRRFASRLAGVGLAALLVVGLAAMPAADDPPQFSEWSTPVNLGPLVNSSATEAGSFITRDGLSLYFSSRQPGGSGNLDLWVSQRRSVDGDWGTPQNLGLVINGAGDDTTPTISVDGHWLYYASDRPEGLGGLDLYISRRHDKRDDLGWGPPVNLGDLINTEFRERGPALFQNETTGATVLYFSSMKPGGFGGEDIYASVLRDDGTFAPSVNVLELNSASHEGNPSVRRDGLELFLNSYREGQFGGGDLYVSTRPDTSAPWSTPVNLGPVVNTDMLDFRPAISFGGTALFFHSARPGGFGDYDLYVTTRTRITGRR